MSRLVLDPIACDGVGLCAHLAPGLITLDRWGYPILDHEPLDDHDKRRARRAAKACPRAALTVDGERSP